MSQSKKFGRIFKSDLGKRKSSARFGINLLIYSNDPRSDLKRLSVVDGGIAKIAAVLFFSPKITV